MEYRKHNFIVPTAKRARAFLVLGLWLFSFSCLMPSAARAHMGGSDRPDYYLVGIDKIIVWANEQGQIKDENPERKVDVAEIDLKKLNQSIADQLRAALPKGMKQKIQIQTIYDSPIHSGYPNKDENALILSFTFGYHVTQLGGRQLVLGAVYSSVNRLPPPELRQARVSGIHGFGYEPAPFLIEGDEASINKSILEATQRCVSHFVSWLAYMPLQMPEHSMDGH